MYVISRFYVKHAGKNDKHTLYICIHYICIYIFTDIYKNIFIIFFVTYFSICQEEQKSKEMLFPCCIFSYVIGLNSDIKYCILINVYLPCYFVAFHIVTFFSFAF